MKYVDIDPRNGTVSWEGYFEYLRSVRNDFPVELYPYAVNREHYSHDGKNSLHDAWLIGAQFGYRSNEVVLALLGAWHDRKHVLTYVGVEAYAFELKVSYVAGDRDVLAHEFRLEDGLVVHEIAFTAGRSILVKSVTMLPATEILS
jgi:hypothetical protein